MYHIKSAERGLSRWFTLSGVDHPGTRIHAAPRCGKAQRRSRGNGAPAREVREIRHPWAKILESQCRNKFTLYKVSMYSGDCVPVRPWLAGLTSASLRLRTALVPGGCVTIHPVRQSSTTRAECVCQRRTRTGRTRPPAVETSTTLMLLR